MEFQDYNEIVRRRYEYALGIDTKDFALLRSIFTNEITMDFEDYSGRPAATMKADDWVNNCKILFTGLDATQHVMTNPIVDIDGDSATCKMYMKAEHFLQNDQGNDRGLDRLSLCKSHANGEVAQPEQGHKQHRRDDLRRTAQRRPTDERRVGSGQSTSVERRQHQDKSDGKGRGENKPGITRAQSRQLALEVFLQGEPQVLRKCGCNRDVDP